MKALTICQPYAHLIARGEKLIENRTWPTQYRGPLFIHAGKSREWLDPQDESRFRDLGDPLVFGAIVARCNLAACAMVGRIEMGDFDHLHAGLRHHQHAEGPWCWVLTDIERIEIPIPCKGRLGLFDVDESLGMFALSKFSATLSMP